MEDIAVRFEFQMNKCVVVFSISSCAIFGEHLAHIYTKRKLLIAHLKFILNQVPSILSGTIT